MSDESAPLVWVVIPTWNRRADLLECLESVARQTYRPLRVIVVDNASTDGSVAAVRTYFPQVCVLALDRNLGASEASNAGFRYVLERGAQYVFRLDSDAIVDPAAIDHLIRAASSPAIGVLSPKIYHYDDPTLIWYGGALRHRWHFGAYDTARGARDAPANSVERDVDYAWATGMLISRAVLEATGGFDPDFFVYYEEVDFCLRARRAGFRIRYVPAAILWHKVGSRAHSPWVAEQWNRSKMLLYRKHSRGWHRWSLIAYAYAYALWSALRRTPPERGNRGPLRAALRGLYAGLTYPLPSTIERRQGRPL